MQVDSPGFEPGASSLASEASLGLRPRSVFEQRESPGVLHPRATPSAPPFDASAAPRRRHRYSAIVTRAGRSQVRASMDCGVATNGTNVTTRSSQRVSRRETTRSRRKYLRKPQTPIGKIPGLV